MSSHFLEISSVFPSLHKIFVVFRRKSSDHVLHARLKYITSEFHGLGYMYTNKPRVYIFIHKTHDIAFSVFSPSYDRKGFLIQNSEYKCDFFVLFFVCMNSYKNYFYHLLLRRVRRSYLKSVSYCSEIDALRVGLLCDVRKTRKW